MPTYTYQFGANPTIDYPRLLIPDTDVTGGATTATFADEEIMMAYNVSTLAVFVAPNQGGVAAVIPGTPSYRWVAATLQDVLAANAGRLGRMLQALDIKLDTRQASADLRASAEALRDAERNSGSFGIAEMCLNQFTMRERWINQVLRIQI